MVTLGIDIGSTAAKAVVLKEEQLTYHLMPTGWSPKSTGEELCKEVLKKANVRKEELTRIVATGYGRETVDFADKTVTEITCHARGAAYLGQGADMVIDIGGQDSKVIKIDSAGRVIDFIMNDKCAAGTGKFLEVIATSLGLDVSELDKFAQTEDFVSINSMCTVFAETEVISLLAKGVTKDKIVGGLHDSVAKRVANMAKKLGVGSKIIFTGGVSLNEAMRISLLNHLQTEIISPPMSQFAGAIGAALIAKG